MIVRVKDGQETGRMALYKEVWLFDEQYAAAKDRLAVLEGVTVDYGISVYDEVDIKLSFKAKKAIEQLNMNDQDTAIRSMKDFFLKRKLPLFDLEDIPDDLERETDNQPINYHLMPLEENDWL